MKQAIHPVSGNLSNANDTVITRSNAGELSPYLFERIYVRLGSPKWFWPAVMSAMVVLWVVGSSVAPGELS